MYCFKMISFEVTCYMTVDNQSLIVTLTSINFRMFSWSADLEGPSSLQYESITLIVIGYDHERKYRLRMKQTLDGRVRRQKLGL